MSLWTADNLNYHIPLQTPADEADDIGGGASAWAEQQEWEERPKLG